MKYVLSVSPGADRVRSKLGFDLGICNQGTGATWAAIYIQINSGLRGPRRSHLFIHHVHRASHPRRPRTRALQGGTPSPHIPRSVPPPHRATAQLRPNVGGTQDARAAPPRAVPGPSFAWADEGIERAAVRKAEGAADWHPERDGACGGVQPSQCRRERRWPVADHEHAPCAAQEGAQSEEDQRRF